MIHSFPYYAPLALFFGLLNEVIPARYGDFLLFPFVIIPTRIEELLVLEKLAKVLIYLACLKDNARDRFTISDVIQSRCKVRPLSIDKCIKIILL